ncbi:MAG: hypothetical protein LBK00_07535 [Treponema sp.]|nr:hypothetical protein [Treponema sp.]
MTEEEAFALDEYYINNPLKVDLSKARIRIPMVYVDSRAAECLLSLSQTTHKTPEESVSELVRERIAASMER